MALTFAVNSMHLSSWGISVGDIATLAGAGRSVVTWLTANARDGNLLDFLHVTEQELQFRPGVVDPVELYQRWSKAITLFRNGRRTDVCPIGPDATLENIARYTWVMTLIVAGLDVAVPNSAVRQIMIDYTAALFADTTLHSEYLQHEIPDHVSGWRSTAVIRNISQRARATWDNFESRINHHLPGHIPRGEFAEIVRFLIWLTASQNQTFLTNSTDIFSFGAVLHDIGFDRLKTRVLGDVAGEEADIGYHTLILDPESIPQDRHWLSRPAQERSCMRIPLETPEEIVSIWPVDSDTQNRLRMIYDNGRHAAMQLEVQVVFEDNADAKMEHCVQFEFSPKIRLPARRWETDAVSLAHALLLIRNDESMKLLSDLIIQWPSGAATGISDRFKLRDVLEGRADQVFGPSRVRQAMEQNKTTGLRQKSLGEPRIRKCIAELKTFLLGHYYTLLQHVIDTSNLGTQEALGAWGWHDERFFRLIAEIVRSSRSGHVDPYHTRISRRQVLKLLAYLYAGIETHQLDDIDDDSAGVIGKLVLLSPSLTGDADTPWKIQRFVLLDVDPTIIPCNARGIVSGGPHRFTEKGKVFMGGQGSLKISDLFQLTTDRPDFTSHIEPAWGFDTTLVMVTYRFQGRLVHRVNPLFAEASVLRHWQGSLTKQELIKTPSIAIEILSKGREGVPTEDPTFIWSMAVEEHVNEQCGTLVEMRHSLSGVDHSIAPFMLLIATSDKSRARSCLAACYGFSLRDMSIVRTEGMRASFDWRSIASEAIVLQITRAGGYVVLF